jgi:hypothetical protein
MPVENILLDQIAAGVYFPSGYEIRQIAEELRSKRIAESTRVHLNPFTPILYKSNQA